MTESSSESYDGAMSRVTEAQICGRIDCKGEVEWSGYGDAPLEDRMGAALRRMRTRHPECATVTRAAPYQWDLS